MPMTATQKTTKTKTKAGASWTYERPYLYPKQFLAMYAPERYAVTEATTKSGKTVSGMAWLTEQAITGEDGQNFWWVAPIYAQAEIAYRRIKRGLPKNVVKPNDSKVLLKFANGTVIWFKSGEKPDTLYGEDVYAAVVDEASRLKEEAWWALRTTLTATRAPVRIIGNVKGRKNWAYRMARKAESGDDPNMHYAKITAYDAIEAGILDPEEIEDARRQLPEAVFRELYLAEPSDDEGNPFGINHIRRCIGKMSVDEPEVWGWDLAKRLNWTVGIALDKRGRVCRFERFQNPLGATTKRIIALTGHTRAIVDSTGIGDQVLEDLEKEGSNYEGYLFTQKSKQQLMEGLAIGIQQEIVEYPEGQIVTELEAFEYATTRTGVSYSAPEGMDDDCVCSLALAWRGFGGGTVFLSADDLKTSYDERESQKVMKRFEYATG